MDTGAEPSVRVTPEEAFGQVLRTLRTERKFSQERLALESGLDRSYVSLLERGRNSPSLSIIFRLAEALAVMPSELVQRTEARASRPAGRQAR